MHENDYEYIETPEPAPMLGEQLNEPPQVAHSGNEGRDSVTEWSLSNVRPEMRAATIERRRFEIGDYVDRVMG